MPVPVLRNSMSVRVKNEKDTSILTPQENPLDEEIWTTQCGMTVKRAELEKRQAMKKNLSPFDAKLYLPMIPAQTEMHRGRKLLVLDIDETLVHVSWEKSSERQIDASFTLQQNLEVFVAYRPHLHEFLEAVAPLFEVAVFTASQSCYADPLMNSIDPTGKLVTHRLFREHCTEVNGARVKDLSLLGRPLEQLLLVDNSPVTYLFQPRNAVPITSFFDDPKDVHLLELLPLLRQVAKVPSVYDILDVWHCLPEQRVATP